MCFCCCFCCCCCCKTNNHSPKLRSPSNDYNNTSKYCHNTRWTPRYVASECAIQDGAIVQNRDRRCQAVPQSRMRALQVTNARLKRNKGMPYNVTNACPKRNKGMPYNVTNHKCVPQKVTSACPKKSQMRALRSMCNVK